MVPIHIWDSSTKWDVILGQQPQIFNIKQSIQLTLPMSVYLLCLTNPAHPGPLLLSSLLSTQSLEVYVLKVCGCSGSEIVEHYKLETSTRWLSHGAIFQEAPILFSRAELVLREQVKIATSSSASWYLRFFHHILTQPSGPSPEAEHKAAQT